MVDNRILPNNGSEAVDLLRLNVIILAAILLVFQNDLKTPFKMENKIT